MRASMFTTRNSTCLLLYELRLDHAQDFDLAALVQVVAHALLLLCQPPFRLAQVLWAIAAAQICLRLPLPPTRARQLTLNLLMTKFSFVATTLALCVYLEAKAIAIPHPKGDEHPQATAVRQ